MTHIITDAIQLLILAAAACPLLLLWVWATNGRI